MKRTNIFFAVLCSAALATSSASAGIVGFSFKVFLGYGLYELVDGASEGQLSEKSKGLLSDVVITFGKGMNSFGKKLRESYENGLTPNSKKYLRKISKDIGGAAMGAVNDAKKEWCERRSSMLKGKQLKKEDNNKKTETNDSEKNKE